MSSKQIYRGRLETAQTDDASQVAAHRAALVKQLGQDFPHDRRTVGNVIDEARGDERLARRALQTGRAPHAITFGGEFEHCDGCDDWQPGVATFAISYATHDGGSAELVRYCPDCAMAARDDATIAAVVEVTA